MESQAAVQSRTLALMNNKYGMINKLTTKPGQRDPVVQILLGAARLQGGMRGCELYIVHTSPDAADVIWVTEAWRSKEDHETSLKNAEVRALIEKGRPMIASIDQTVTMPMGGKGLSG